MKQESEKKRKMELSKIADQLNNLCLILADCCLGLEISDNSKNQFAMLIYHEKNGATTMNPTEIIQVFIENICRA